MKLFQYAVLLHPTEAEKRDGKETRVLVPITAFLARDQQTATLKAFKAIDPQYAEMYDRIEVAVRPF